MTKVMRAIARDAAGKVVEIFEWEVSKHSQSYHTRRRVKKWFCKPDVTVTFEEGKV
jgi:hypothetical protein